MSVAVVAAAWATMPGCVRTVGHVTAVIQRISLVACATAPSTDQTNGLSPCASVHGWKWSDSHGGAKARGFGLRGRVDDLRGGALLGGEEDPDLCHARRVPAAARP